MGGPGSGALAAGGAVAGVGGVMAADDAVGVWIRHNFAKASEGVLPFTTAPPSSAM